MFSISYRYMKTAFLAFLALSVGFSLGTYYGWRTGCIDGQVRVEMMTLSVLKQYGSYRSSPETAPRDRVMDMLAMSSAQTFAHGNSFSPFYRDARLAADLALLEVAAFWELNAREPSLTKDGRYLPLFSEGSPESVHLEKLKQEHRPFYGKELERQQKLREAMPLEFRSPSPR